MVSGVFSHVFFPTDFSHGCNGHVSRLGPFPRFYRRGDLLGAQLTCVRLGPAVGSVVADLALGVDSWLRKVAALGGALKGAVSGGGRDARRILPLGINGCKW